MLSERDINFLFKLANKKKHLPDIKKSDLEKLNRIYVEKGTLSNAQLKRLRNIVKIPNLPGFEKEKPRY